MTVWVFNEARDTIDRNLNVVPAIYKSITKDGKSRFGWSFANTHDLRKEENKKYIRDNKNSESNKPNTDQLRLLDIKEGDWIIHVNTPEDNLCTAAKTTSTYKFDKGIQSYWNPDRKDFKSYFEIDKNSIIIFNRNNPMLSEITGSLKTQGRIHRMQSGKISSLILKFE